MHIHSFIPGLFILGKTEVQTFWGLHACFYWISSVGSIASSILPV